MGFAISIGTICRIKPGLAPDLIPRPFLDRHFPGFEEKPFQTAPSRLPGWKAIDREVELIKAGGAGGSNLIARLSARQQQIFIPPLV
ncbi:hypothetical protein LJR245_002330 [Rhizobium leguminosarum]|uniref:hypothetical protein n=1 Tax=Rhizobium leguminosarum TaxID=384 RepID=UPI003ECCB836